MLTYVQGILICQVLKVLGSEMKKASSIRVVTKQTEEAMWEWEMNNPQ